MTIKEFIQTKVKGVTFSDLEVKRMLLDTSLIDGCILDKEVFDIEDIEADVLLTLSAKGRDVITAQAYYLLSADLGIEETVTADGVTVRTKRSFGVTDRREFKDMADELYEFWGLIDYDDGLIMKRSFESL